VGVACGFLVLPLLAITAAILWLSTDGVRGG
jgi:hypothetical protein